MIAYRVLLVAILLIIPLRGPLPAQSPDTGEISQASPRTALEAGTALFRQEAFEEALPYFQQAVQADGSSAPAHYWLGMAQYELGGYREALSSFRRAARQDKSWAAGHIGMGNTYLKLKNRKLDARNALRTAVRLEPDNPDAQYYLGMSFMNDKKVDAIVGSDRDGRTYFLEAVALNPSHPDAFYQLGRCYDSFPEPEYGNAMHAYFNQYRVNPEHRRAFERFANVCLRTEAFEKGAELLDQLVEEAGDAATDEVRNLQFQFSLLSDSTERQFDRLQEALETYISGLDPDEQAVYRDLSHVAPPDELDAWMDAEGPERDALWQAFWNARDSNPATVENERLVEHYRRVIYALYHFSQGQHPYDRRGEIYVRYGEPENRRGDVYIADRNAYQGATFSDDAAVDAVREQNARYGYQLRVDSGYLTIVPPEEITEEEINEVGGLLADGIVASRSDLGRQGERKLMGHGYATESWVYARYGLELFFVDQFGGGRFDYPWGNLLTNQQEAVRQERFSPRRLAEELIAKAPEEYLHDFGGDRLEYAFDAVSFRSDDGYTELDLSFSIPVWQFGDVSDGRGTRTRLEHQVTLRDSVMSPQLTHEFDFGPFHRPKRKMAESHVKVPVYTLPASVVAPPGSFTMAVQVRDETSRRIGVYRKPVTLSDYSGEELLISDLKLATLIAPSGVQGPFVRKGLNITPNPGRLYIRGNPVYVYYELYNLALDQDGKTAYEILYEISPLDGNGPRGWSARRQRDMQTVMMAFSGEGYATEDREYTSLDTRDLPAGEYVLTVTLTDLNAGSTVSKPVNFLVMER
ncbi:MAG: tetratricopeptide repeat protein [Gemmatimonadetes bacterium]|nr:tetratricopeptide repeat protein [Gemmatimonadota bacterium]